MAFSSAYITLGSLNSELRTSWLKEQKYTYYFYLTFLWSLILWWEHLLYPLCSLKCTFPQVDSIWMPDIEILNLKDFSTLDVLSKLEGLWLNKDGELIYAVASRITWICPMTFDSFPLDVQVNHIFSYLDNIFMIFLQGLSVPSRKFQLWHHKNDVSRRICSWG